MRAAKAPCAACPWRTDAQPGHFPLERYQALTATVGEGPGREAPMGAPAFACHASAEGKEIACAGWLAIEGHNHLGMRLAAACGEVEPEAFEPEGGWPALYPSFAAMVAAQQVY